MKMEKFTSMFYLSKEKDILIILGTKCGRLTVFSVEVLIIKKILQMKSTLYGINSILNGAEKISNFKDEAMKTSKMMEQ